MELRLRLLRRRGELVVHFASCGGCGGGRVDFFVVVSALLPLQAVTGDIVIAVINLMS